MKNYIGFSKDASGSMGSLARAAIKDYNANITAVKDAATAHMLDTIVYSNSFASSVTREVVNSNPHVLKPLERWDSSGLTALYDGIGDLIEQFEKVPDINDQKVSFLIMATTDGEENHSQKWTSGSLANKIKELQATERWTFVVRVPKGQRHTVSSLGIPEGNIQEWDTTTAGIEASAVATTQSMTKFYATRASGQKGSSVFFADAAQVDTSTLKDITDQTSLYVVAPNQNGMELRDFILKHRQVYLKGSAFYQLTKTEPRVQHDKIVAVRDRNPQSKTFGKVYAGKDARKMIGLPDNANARLHPGDHKDYDIFIQSKSVNRKLVAQTGVLYWEAIGEAFSDDDLNKFAPTKVNGVVQLPAVPVTNKPTPSPLKPVSKAPQVVFYATRDLARDAARKVGKSVVDHGKASPKGQRYSIN